jgi:hypothetical protein
MARFYGEVGYGASIEDPPNSGIWVEVITEYTYTGDVIRNTRQLETGDKVNTNIVVSNSISVVADEYAIMHFFDIKYVRWSRVLWTVTAVEVRSPRLILNIGSVYNGPTP